MAGTSPAMTSNVFTLAHLSDPHLPLPSVRWSDLNFKQLTGYGNWLLKRRRVHDPAVLRRIVGDLKITPVDHIAITGDLSNIAHPDEFKQARQWLAGIGSDDDITIIPGNHDAYIPGGDERMRAELEAFMRGDDGGTGFPFLRRRANVAIIAVNTGVPTLPFMATGHAGPQQIERLASLLSALEREKMFRVVLIHHPPAGDVSPRKKLIDAGAFNAVIAERGAELVLHGHNHLQELHWLDGPAGHVPAVGVPSASGAPGKARNAAAYNLYRIDGQAGAWRCEMETRGIGADGHVGSLKRVVLMA
jgi:3',5'-cyclic AMP phosphodiesterase CpdA